MPLPPQGLTWRRCTNSARHTFNLRGLIWPPAPAGGGGGRRKGGTRRTELQQPQTWQSPGSLCCLRRDGVLGAEPTGTTRHAPTSPSGTSTLIGQCLSRAGWLMFGGCPQGGPAPGCHLCQGKRTQVRPWFCVEDKLHLPSGRRAGGCGGLKGQGAPSQVLPGQADVRVEGKCGVCS